MRTARIAHHYIDSAASKPAEALQAMGGATRHDLTNAGIAASAAPLFMMTNVRAERLLKIPAELSPGLRIPNAAAQTRIVPKARIQLECSCLRAPLLDPACWLEQDTKRS